MNRLSRRQLLAWIATGPCLPEITAAGAATPDQASLLFVNAVADAGLAFFVLDKRDLSPGGYRTGQATGWLQFPAATAHTLRVEHEPLGRISVPLELEADTFQAIILHSRTVPAKRKGRPPVRGIGAFVLKCPAPAPTVAGGRAAPGTLTLLSVSAKAGLELTVGKTAVSLDPLKPHVLKVDRGMFLHVTALPPVPKAPAGDAPDISAGPPAPPEPVPIASLNMEEPAARFIVIHDKADGTLGGVVLTLGARTAQE